MKERCYSPNSKDYKDYGNRGITVCDEWKHDFKCFFDWAIPNGWEPGLLIDRQDVNGSYNPGNCRFVGTLVNSINRRLLYSNNTSGFRGVSFSMAANKWTAQIQFDNKMQHIGVFKTKREAAQAYDNKAKKLSNEFPLNFN